MRTRRMLPVWILAAVVALVVGFLLVGSLRQPAASFNRSATATPSPSSAGSAGASVPATATVLPSAPASPIPADTLLALGDTASCQNTHDSDVAALATALPGQIALLGDLAYDNGTAQDYADCFAPVWGPLKSRLRPAPGNHDYNTSSASAYYDYFGADAGTAGEGWYAYEIGSWRILSLNSNCGAVGCGVGSPQLDWLRAQLADAPSCTLTYWHHPRYSSGHHGDNGFVGDLWGAAVDGGVDVVLGGHDHDYERLTADGVREFVVGTGGRSLYEWPDGPSSLTEARTNASYGLLELTLGDGSYTWRFVPVGDASFTDTGTGTCH